MLPTEVVTEFWSIGKEAGIASPAAQVLKHPPGFPDHPRSKKVLDARGERWNWSITVAGIWRIATEVTESLHWKPMVRSHLIFTTGDMRL